MRITNAGNGREFEAWFETVSGEPTVPPTVHWRLRCMTTGTLLQDLTEVPIEIISDGTGITGVKATIEIDGALNEMQNTRNPREVRQLEIIAAYGTPHQYSEEPLQYYVFNTAYRRH